MSNTPGCVWICWEACSCRWCWSRFKAASAARPALPGLPAAFGEGDIGLMVLEPGPFTDARAPTAGWNAA